MMATERPACSSCAYEIALDLEPYTYDDHECGDS